MRKVIFLGAGGHARVLFEIARKEFSVLGALAKMDSLHPNWHGLQVLGEDSAIRSYSPEDVALVNAVGSSGLPTLRQALYEKFAAMGFTFVTMRHPSSLVAAEVQLGAGSQVMAGAVLQPGCLIGENSIVNTGAIIDHDCQVGPHCHIAPGSTLSGSVVIGAGTHLGTGCSVIQGVKIGSRCVVGAGAVVVKDIPDGTTVVGNPARPIGSR